jgi:hypothetical protein
MSELLRTLEKVGNMLDMLDFRASPELAEHRARKLLRARREIKAQAEALRQPEAIHTRVENIMLRGIN